MAESETLVFRASLRPKIYRDIEIAGTGSLYTLAQAIVRFLVNLTRSSDAAPRPTARTPGAPANPLVGLSFSSTASREANPQHPHPIVELKVLPSSNRF